MRGPNKMNEKKYQPLRKKSMSKRGGCGLYRHADTRVIHFFIADGFRRTYGGYELETLNCA